MSKSFRDNDLLDRFNALKSSIISTETVPAPNRDQKQDDLAARFLRFSASEQRAAGKTEDLDMTTTPVVDTEEDNKTLDDLLADIGPQDQWLVGLDESKDIERLLDEAKTSLLNPTQETEESIHGDEETDPIDHASNTAADLSEEVQREAEDSVQAASRLITSNSEQEEKAESPTEEEEAALSLQRILDELSLENSLSNPDLLSKQETSLNMDQIPQPKGEQEDSIEVDLGLPSAPETAPSLQATTTRFQFDELGLPSAPTSKPSKKMAKTNLPTYTNEEIDSWCIICNDDATVRCSGCDNDLYCAKCWREGHTGPDVGYEEKRHKWTKYAKARE